MANTKLCAAITDKDDACSVKIPDNRQYCSVYHEQYQEYINSGYTKELLDRCVKCKKYLIDEFFSDTNTICNTCNDLTHKKKIVNDKCYICETNKVARINCGKYIGKDKKKYCALHLTHMTRADLIFEGKNVCKGHRRIRATVIEADKNYCTECDTKINIHNTYSTTRKKH